MPDGIVYMPGKTLLYTFSNPKEPLIPGIYETSWKNLGYHLRNVDRILDGNTYAKDDPSNAAAQALLRTTSELLPFCICK